MPRNEVTLDEVVLAKKKLHDYLDDPKNTGFLVVGMNDDGCTIGVVGCMRQSNIEEAISVLILQTESNPINVLMNCLDLAPRRSSSPCPDSTN